MTIKYSVLVLIMSVGQVLFSQVEEVSPPDFIKTITFKGETDVAVLPIIKLGESLQLEFDVLNGEEADYYYKITYYNYDWTPSSLAVSEYVDGFDNQRVPYYENSYGTYQLYSHYTLQLPNQNTRALKVSGNYLLSVFNETGDLMFSRKFMVYQNNVGVGVTIRRSRDVSFISEKQAVDIKIKSNQPLNNPKENVRVNIIQNDNLNTMISGVKPQYILGNELQYKYIKKTSFWGGNEYFYFENKDIRAANLGVQFTELKALYHNYIYANVYRKPLPYTYNPDINGGFLINALDVENSAIEADYAVIHFALKHDKVPDAKSVHVYGNFNNYSLTDATKMTYNPEAGLYTAKLLLKQGFYNYKYVLVDANAKVEEGAISGNFFQTENNYKVLVYYRDIGGRFDKIIGLGERNSVSITN